MDARGPATPDGPSRRRGNAFYVDSARAALGLREEVHSLSDVPLPLVHTALGVAVCALVAALRPQAVGLAVSTAATGGLALLAVVSLTVYDHLVYGRHLATALASMALPAAAIGAFLAVLGGSQSLSLRLPAGAAAALIIGGVPHLGGLRAAGREGSTTRLVRDATGIAVLAPLLLAAFSGTLSNPASAALAGGAAVLVTADALLTEALAGRIAVLLGVLVGAAFAGLVVLLPVAGRGTLRVAFLLLLWYGVRGLAGVFASGVRGRAPAAEYSLFVVSALVGLAVTILRG